MPDPAGAVRGEAAERSQRFLREARAAARLQHPNIVTIYDFGIDDGVPYLVMEKLTGQDLDRLMTLEVETLLDVRLEWVMQTLAGLEAAHAAGLVHRDIKPANLFLTTRGASRSSISAWSTTRWPICATTWASTARWSISRRRSSINSPRSPPPTSSRSAWCCSSC
jgi:serine/threonine protein kinase